jgi:2'-5' RNA ligase
LNARGQFGRRRLFLAIWIPPALRRALLQEVTRRLPAGAGRRVAGADLHLTLLFLGPVASGRLQALVAACRRLRAPSFELRLTQTSCWGEGRLWVVEAEPVPALLELQRRLRASIARLGIALESRPYRPHVTLARDLPRTSGVTLAARQPALRGRIGSYCLAESMAPVSGRRYRILVRWPLRG